MGRCVSHFYSITHVTGQCVLENVKLRPEAFDYLKLPIAIGSGSIGRLSFKVTRGDFESRIH